MLPVKFITQELVLKDVFPTLGLVKDGKPIDFKEICEEHGLSEDVEFIRKGLVASDLKFEEGERAVISHITTDTIDRDGEIVDPKGAILEDYEKNPVVLFGHDHRRLPIGRNMWIKRDKKGLVAKTTYATHQLAEDVYQYRKQGFPLAQSIGFIPLQSERYEEGSPERKQGVLRKYTKWILLEYSDVPVPSNPDAVAIAISKGLVPKDYISDDKEDESSSSDIDESIESKEEEKINILEKIEDNEDSSSYDSNKKPSVEITVKVVKEDDDFIKLIAEEKPGWEETDSSFRGRVRDPGLFQDGTFRTVPIKRDKPRVTSVMGKLKGQSAMKIQALIFPKTEGWTMQTAKSWLSSHGDLLKYLDDEDIKSFLKGHIDENDNSVCHTLDAKEDIADFIAGYYGMKFDGSIKESDEDVYLIEEDEEKEVPEGSIFVDPEIIKSVMNEKLANFKKEFKEITTGIIKDEFNRMRGKV